MHNELEGQYRRDVELCDKLLRRLADATPTRYDAIQGVRRAKAIAEQRLASFLETEPRA